MVFRVIKRDSCTIEEAKSRIAAQMSLKKKREMADFVIDNSGALEDSKEQVEKVKAILKKKRPLFSRNNILLLTALTTFIVAWFLAK